MDHPEANPEVIFLTSYPDVPAELPTGWPHIIDSAPLKLSRDMQSTPEQINLIDVIPTVLYQYNPEFLKKFLDLAIERVTFTWQSPTNGVWDLLIERNKNIITVGCALAIKRSR